MATVSKRISNVYDVAQATAQLTRGSTYTVPNSCTYAMITARGRLGDDVSCNGAAYTLGQQFQALPGQVVAATDSACNLDIDLYTLTGQQDTAGFPSPVSGAGTGGYYDVFCYGATLASLECAKEAISLGLRVIVVDPLSHIGGMFTGGISATDISYTEFSGQVSGPATELLKACADEKGLSYEAFWRAAATVEPTVAQKVLQRRIAAAGVKVVTNAPLSSVRKDGTNVVEAICGSYRFTFGHWFDGSYEGDLLRAAGCAYRYGRDANAFKSESYNGVRPYGTAAQFVDGVDPYVTPGVQASGPLPGATEIPQGTLGAASDAVMAPCYRMLVCKSGGTGYTKVTMPNAANYNPLNYELLGRHFAQAASGASSYTDIASKFLYVAITGTTKNDLNSGSLPLSTNWIFPNRWRDEYVFGTQAQRVSIRDEIWDYTLGVFQFLRNDTRLSAAARADAALIGFASDTWVATGGRPPQLYVRETILMTGDTVYSEQDAIQARSFTDGVATAYYKLDAHHCQRIYVPGVGVKNEGYLDQAVNTVPNEIPFAVMRPRAVDSTNGLVGFCFSVTHTLFCSYRMEPIIAQMGRAAGRAIGMAVRNGVKVAAISGAAVKAELDRWVFAPPGGLIASADGTTFTGGTTTTFGAAWSQGVVSVGEPPHQVSSQGATIVGSVTGTSLTVSSTTSGTVGTPTGLLVEGPGISFGTTITGGAGPYTLSNSATVAGGTTIFLRAAKRFAFTTTAEPKDVFVRYVVKNSSTRSTAAVFFVEHAAGVLKVTQNQQAGGDGGDWVQIAKGLSGITAVWACTDAAGGATVIAAVELRRA
jgi:hypothetical protein